MTEIANTGTPRERILATASELFYQQGFRATGVNEVIKQSGVAKATFSENNACTATTISGYTVPEESILM